MQIYHCIVILTSCLTSRGSQVRALLFPPEYGPVVQLVRTLACHARGRRFEPVPGRHFCLCSSVGRAEDWKSSCRWFDSVRRHQICGCSSSGRAPPCQGGGSEFEPRHPLHQALRCFFYIVSSGSRLRRRHSQVVRHESAKLWSPGSNPGGASKK